MFRVEHTSQFKKDYKKAAKRGACAAELAEVVSLLAERALLPRSMSDHSIGEGFKGCRECHIRPDMLLMYKVDDVREVLTLVRLGSHSDLFG